MQGGKCGMIAKVSLSSVKAFNQAAIDSRDFSPEFDRGINCIEQLLKILTDLAHEVNEKISEMQTAKEKLTDTIRGLKENIARFTAQLNELQDKVSSFESKLSSMSSSLTMTEKNVEENKIPNPAYIELKAQISVIQSKISVVKAELYLYKQRLDRAHSVNSQLYSQIDDAISTAYSLNEKENTCKQLIKELGEIKKSNLKKSTAATVKLGKIELQVASYMRIKMFYDAGNNSVESGTSAGQSGININININNTAMVNELQNQQSELSREDIEKHQIEYDDDDHICEFEGRKYGGKFNSYKDRIDGTSKENPVLGKYEGIRGESKYIPSNRSAEQIAVIDILKKHGLDGIEYRNGEPDFEVCADAIVRIKGMTANRENYSDENGLIQLGNFSQADIELARLWNLSERGMRIDWSAREVFEYRKANGLTWHEKCDTETMVLVKSEINAYFKHVGGCSECRLRDAAGDKGGFDE